MCLWNLMSHIRGRTLDLQKIRWGVGRGLDRSGSGQGQVTGPCERSNESLGSIKFGEFLDWLRNELLFKKDSVPRSWLARWLVFKHRQFSLGWLHTWTVYRLGLSPLLPCFIDLKVVLCQRSFPEISVVSWMQEQQQRRRRRQHNNNNNNNFTPS